MGLKVGAKLTAYKYFFLVGFFFLLQIGSGYGLLAQEDDKQDPDIELYADEVDTLLYRTHSPKRASLYSAALPGMGQIYNKQIWKVPIIYVGYGIIGYFIFDNLTNYKDYTNLYSNYLRGGDQYKDFLPNYQNYDIERTLKGGKDYYRRYLEISIISALGLYVLNIIDATVAAYFFEYDISENIVLNISPAVLPAPDVTRTVGLSCSFHF
jgi:hypothetical protein